MPYRGMRRTLRDKQLVELIPETLNEGKNGILVIERVHKEITRGQMSFTPKSFIEKNEGGGHTTASRG